MKKILKALEVRSNELGVRLSIEVFIDYSSIVSDSTGKSIYVSSTIKELKQWLKPVVKEKPLYINSVGEEFYKGDTCYFYSLMDSKSFERNIDNIRCGYKEGAYSTEIAKTEKQALKFGIKMIEARETK